MKDTIKYIIGGGIALLLVAGYFFQTGKLKKEAAMWRENYTTEQTAFGAYKEMSNGLITTYKNQIRLTEAELRKELKENDSLNVLVKYYKKLASVTTVVTEWKHDTIKLYTPVYIGGAIDTTYNIGDACFKGKINVKDGALTLSDLSISNEQNVVTGVRKAGFFKKEYSFDVTNSNPCMTITGMNSYKVVSKPKFWENPLYVGIATFVTGVYIGDRINR